MQLIRKFQHPSGPLFPNSQQLLENYVTKATALKNDNIGTTQQRRKQQDAAIITEVHRKNQEYAKKNIQKRAAIGINSKGQPTIVKNANIRTNTADSNSPLLDQAVDKLSKIPIVGWGVAKAKQAADLGTELWKGVPKLAPGVANYVIGQVENIIPDSWSWAHKATLPTDVMYDDKTKQWHRADGVSFRYANRTPYVNGLGGRVYLNSDGTISYGGARDLKDQFTRNMNTNPSPDDYSTYLAIKYPSNQYKFGNFNYSSTVGYNSNMPIQTQVMNRVDESLNRNKTALQNYFHISDKEWDEVVRDTYGALRRESAMGTSGGDTKAKLNPGTKLLGDIKSWVGDPSVGLGAVKIGSDVFTDQERKDLGFNHYIDHTEDATSPEFSAVATAAAVRKFRQQAKERLANLPNLSEEEKKQLETVFAQTAYNQGWKNIDQNIKYYLEGREGGPALDKSELHKYDHSSAIVRSRRGYSAYDKRFPKTIKNQKGGKLIERCLWKQIIH